MRTGFIVLPGTSKIPDVPTLVPFEATKIISHASGIPWVVGRWAADEVVTASAGPVRVVVIGHCPITTGQLKELASRIESLHDVSKLAQQLSGSFHLIVSVHGKVRIQGSVTGLRRLFYAKTRGCTIAADRADLLAVATRATVNEEALATRVACGGMLPPPLGEQSMWTGVAVVPPDHYMALDEGKTARWWSPPAPKESLQEGAQAVRAALDAAVASRTREHTSADLSGGMDSTSLTFLAAQKNPNLLTFRWGEAELGNDDGYFSSVASASLPHARHLIVPQAQLKELFSEPRESADTEQPYLFSRTLGRTHQTAQILSDQGSDSHIAGHGGDELFYKFPGYLHRLIRRHPLLGIQHARAHKALSRWPLSDTFRQLSGSGDIKSWWDAQVDSLGSAPPSSRFPPLEWNFVPLRAQKWVTSKALEIARSRIRGQAESAVPFAADRGQHQFLLALRTTGPSYGQLARVYAGHGVRLHMPFLDDRVVEAALAVRLHERVDPWRYKPLLAEAMTGITPNEILSRSTKGEFSGDIRRGRRRYLSKVLDVFSDSALASRGLIDADLLRTEILSPQADMTLTISLEQLLGCETWLRSANELVKGINGSATKS
ncbi:asparagine synthase-related protein [Streptomyces sp. NPDC090303]|uniref:asparagine synthase-related protein n=1 Tax=Streptomyces sp. NPDC090303 TaxID=3365960 RepID=UPI00382FA1F1